MRLSCRKSSALQLGILVAVTASGLVSPVTAASGATSKAVSSHTVHCLSCGRNLIKNPGAEAGKGTAADTQVKVPHWTATKHFTAAQYAWSGGDVSATSPGPKRRGKNYFYGGPDSSLSTGTQTIKVRASGISTGKVRYKLSGWLGGYDSQRDNATLTASFETGSGKVLKSGQIGPVTEKQRKGISKLLHRSTAGKVPSGTRQIVLELVMRRTDGSDNDGLADDLSLVLTA